jgi:acyl-CoA dehydrogenase
MDNTAEMLRDTATKLFAEHTEATALRTAEQGVWPEKAWAAVEEAGLHRALVDEDAGGYGLPVADALSLLRVAGEHALPLPLAETLLAGWLLAGARIGIPDGPLTVAPVAGETLQLKRNGDGWRLTGTASRVPWGRNAVAAAVLADADGTPMVALVPASGWRTEPGENIAREPRDTLHIDALLPADTVGPARVGAAKLRAAGAAMRAMQISGALARITAMTTQYAMDRVQFGRPIGKFQAIQQNLAIMAGQTAAAIAAADVAAEGFADNMRILPIAAGKSRTGEAAGIAAGHAHQIHGAIGFTYEHSLHFFTKRLWAWRDEFGNEAEWNLLLGRHMAKAGGDNLWAELTAA